MRQVRQADLAFICGENGRPLKKESFGNAFSEAARMAGVNKSAHGVCKIAATRAADNCATVHELMAIVGWKTIPMAEVYTREANRRRLELDDGCAGPYAAFQCGGAFHPSLLHMRT